MADDRKQQRGDTVSLLSGDPFSLTLLPLSRLVVMLIWMMTRQLAWHSM
jgi:hypothetical protein